MKVNTCGVLPVSLIQALAAAVVEDIHGNTFLNLKYMNVFPCACSPAYTCDLQGIDLENFVVSKIVTVDDCGHTAIKVGYCDLDQRPQ